MTGAIEYPNPNRADLAPFGLLIDDVGWTAYRIAKEARARYPHDAVGENTLIRWTKEADAKPRLDRLEQVANILGLDLLPYFPALAPDVTSADADNTTRDEDESSAGTASGGFHGTITVTGVQNGSNYQGSVLNITN